MKCIEYKKSAADLDVCLDLLLERCPCVHTVKIQSDQFVSHPCMIFPRPSKTFPSVKTLTLDFVRVNEMEYLISRDTACTEMVQYAWNCYWRYKFPGVVFFLVLQIALQSSNFCRLPLSVLQSEANLSPVQLQYIPVMHPCVIHLIIKRCHGNVAVE